MRYTLIVVFSIFLVSGVRSQDSIRIRHKPKHAFKISPVHLWGFYPTLQLAYEIGVSERVGLQFDAGYVVNYGRAVDSDYLNKRGTKLKMELRYYFESLPNSADGFYMSIEPYYSHIKFDRAGSSTECFDPLCQNLFTRYFNYEVTYREKGVSIKGGYVIFFDQHILLDINIGWSLRDIRYDEPPNTIDTFQNNFFFFGPNEEDRVILSPLVGIRVGYRFQ